MSAESLEAALRELQAENALLRHRLGRYEELYGHLAEGGHAAPPMVSPAAMAAAAFPGVPVHSPTGSALAIPNFSQEGNALPPQIFQNPYGHSSPPPPSAPQQQIARSSNPGSSADLAAAAAATAAAAAAADYDSIPTFPLRPSFREAGPAARRSMAGGAASSASGGSNNNSSKQQGHSAEMHVYTELVHFAGHLPNDPYKASNTPLYLSSTFIQPSADEYGPYDYSRSGNPTRTALETLSAKLEGAHAAFSFGSGMAALQAVIAGTVKNGECIIASSDLYGGMHRDLMFMKSQYGVEVEFVDTTDLAAVEAALLRNSSAPVRLVHLESPSNPLMRITDLRAVAELTKRLTGGRAKVSVDATMMTPLRQQPLALGCDFVVHSATKFYSGHSDTTAGIVACADEKDSKIIGFIQNAQGTGLDPFSCFMLLRGLKTMALRLERAEVNAVAIAQFLTAQTHFVKRVYYAGLEPIRGAGGSKKKDHDASAAVRVPPQSAGDDERVELLKSAAAKFKAGHGLCSANDVLAIKPAAFDLHWDQATGPGTVISFETGSVARSKRFVDGCKLFKLTVSFGAVSSSVEMPSLLSHASIKKECRTLPEDLVRLSIGVEHVFDLMSDLIGAIREAMSVE